VTCIVGVRDERGVTLAGDSLGVSGMSIRTRVDPKVFLIKPWLAAGFTTSFRMGQILRFHVTTPPKPPKRGGEYAWAVKRYVPAIRSALEQHCCKPDDKGGPTFLLAIGTELFTVYGDFQVGHHHDDYAACGGGEDFAIAALAAGASPLSALEITTRYYAGAAAPFHVVRTKALP